MTPLTESQAAPRLLSIEDVKKRTSLCRASIYRMVKAGTFPPALPINGRRMGWVEQEVNAWINSRIAARPQGQHWGQHNRHQ